GPEGHDRGPNKERTESDMQVVSQSGIEGRRRDNAHEGEKIRESDHAAFVVFLWPVLDERIDGNNKEAAGKAERSEQDHYLNKGEPMRGDRQGKNRHANRAEWYQTVFNLPGGKEPGGYAPEADADGEGGLQVAAVRFVEVQDIPAVKNDHKLEE